MKIIMLTPWFPDDRQKNHGIFISQQAQAISRVHEVVVLSSKIDYAHFSFCSFEIKSVTNNLVIEHRLLIKKSLPVYNQLNYFLVSLWVSFKIASKFRPDLIHANIGYPGGFWGWMLSRLIRRPFIVTEHNSFFINNFRSSLHRITTLFALRRAASVVTVGDQSRSVMQNILKRPVLVVPNIVRVERFGIKSVASGIVQIGFLGGLSSPKHPKGLDILIKCLGKVNFDFVLRIGGGGEMLPYYKEMASRELKEGSYIFHDFIEPDEVPTFMSHLHFFVNCSQHESFGIAIAEALASGVPVLGFRNGGGENFVESGGCLLIDKNESALLDGLKQMQLNYQSYDRQKMRNYIVDHYSEAAFEKNMNDVYLSISRVKN